MACGQRGGIADAQTAVDEFDSRWQRFTELPNDEEHLLGPAMTNPAGIWYFDQFVADCKLDGSVEYIIDVREHPTILVKHMTDALRTVLDDAISHLQCEIVR